MSARAARALRRSPTDAARIMWLEDQGWRVLRFWNNDILANTEGVIEVILATLRAA